LEFTIQKKIRILGDILDSLDQTIFV